MEKSVREIVFISIALSRILLRTPYTYHYTMGIVFSPESQKTAMIPVVVLAAVFLMANAGCNLPQGTNGSHEVLFPDDILRSSIPSDVLTTPSSVNSCRIHRNDYYVGNSSLLASTWSPSGYLTSSPPPPPSSPSFPIVIAWLAIVIGFTVNLIGWMMFQRGRVAVVFGFAVNVIGWMMLRRGHPTAANLCRYAGLFSVAVAFFSMTYMFVPDCLAWAVWASAGVLGLVFTYSLAERL